MAKKKFTIPTCETCDARNCSVFNELPERDLQKISLHKGCNFYKADQILFHEGGYPAGLYCIHKGKVKLFKVGLRGQEQIVRLAKEGAVVGYRAFVSGDRYVLTAMTMEDSTICFIPRQTVFELIRISIPFNLRIINLLSNDLKDAESKEIALAQKTVRERLAETILLLSDFFGVDNDGTIKEMLPRREFASMVGTSVETIIRELSLLKKRGVIGLKGRQIKIINLKTLTALSRVVD